MFKKKRVSGKSEVVGYLSVTGNGASFVCVSYVDGTAYKLYFSDVYFDSDHHLGEEGVVLGSVVRMKIRSLLVGYAGSKRFRGLDRLMIVLDSTWTFTQVRRIVRSEDGPFRVEKGDLDKMLHEEQERVVSELMGGDMEKSGLYIHEFKVVGVEANGFRVEKVEGAEVKNLELEVLVSLGDFDLLKEITKMAWYYFREIPVEIHSAAFVMSFGLSSVLTAREDYVYLSLGEYVTEIVVVKGGYIVDILSFPMGRRKIMGAFRKKVGRSDSDVKNMFRLAVCPTCSPIMESRVKNGGGVVLSEWTKGITDLLFEYRKKGVLPSFMVFSAVSPMAELLLPVLKDLEVEGLISPVERWVVKDLSSLKELSSGEVMRALNSNEFVCGFSMPEFVFRKVRDLN